MYTENEQEEAEQNVSIFQTSSFVGKHYSMYFFFK